MSWPSHNIRWFLVPHAITCIHSRPQVPKRRSLTSHRGLDIKISSLSELVEGAKTVRPTPAGLVSMLCYGGYFISSQVNPQVLVLFACLAHLPCLVSAQVRISRLTLMATHLQRTRLTNSSYISGLTEP
jgi:hypothetical protein